MQESRSLRVRWMILGCLFGFSIFGYMQRTGITIFLVGYTVFQVPAAVLGEYWGSRRALTWMGATTQLATIATAITPRLARSQRARRLVGAGWGDAQALADEGRRTRQRDQTVRGTASSAVQRGMLTAILVMNIILARNQRGACCLPGSDSCRSSAR
jgi:hypothetical protein